MQINITDVLSCEQKRMEWTAPVELEAFVSALGTFPIREKSPCRLTVTNLGADRLRVEGAVELTAVIPCDRCLEDVKTRLELTFDRELEVRPAGENGMTGLDCQASGKADSDEDSPDETEFIFGYNLDVDELVYSEMLMNWPMKTLCRESCKGICRRCGANLNHGPCGCDTVELDPRMAAIRDIFKTVNEEV